MSLPSVTLNQTRPARKVDPMSLAAVDGAVADGFGVGPLGGSFALSLEAAILTAITYGDVFDFSLECEEIQRRLILREATVEEVEKALATSRYLIERVRCVEGLYCLAGRERLVEVRLRRRSAACRLWSRARSYARLLASVPFVRGIMVTGALASENEDEDGDIDFLVVVRSGFLWRSHALIWCLVKLDKLFASGKLCVNYYLTDEPAALPEQTLYVAYELALMTPLYGGERYRALREQNGWSDHFLRNAAGTPAQSRELEPRAPRIRDRMESALDSKVGRWIERSVHALKLRRVAARPDRVTQTGAESPADGWAHNERQRRVAEYREQGLGFRGRHTPEELTLCDLDFGGAILAEVERRWSSVRGNSS